MTRLLPGALMLAACAALGADSIQIANPSFQADNFPTFPGYRGGSNPVAITGWGGTAGINGTDIGAGVPFADNGAISDGTRVAFIQGAGTLSQTLSGFTIGQRYWVQVWMNARACCGDQPRASVTLGGQSLLALQQLAPVGGTDPYYLANFVWTATSASAGLVISAQPAAGGDASAVFDAVAVIQRSAAEVVLANPSFEASGQAVAAPGYVTNLAGWTRFGTGNTGVNTTTGPFHDNGLIPDGMNVLLLQRAAGVQQAVAGLTPGQTYRLRFQYNSRAASEVPRLRVRLGGLTALEELVPPVGAGQPYRTLAFDFTAESETAALVLENLGLGADSAVLVDNVSIAAIGTAVPPALALPSPGAPGDAGGIVTFNEVNYHPPGTGGAEWIELANQMGTRVDLSGWRITGGVNFTFADGVVIEPGAFLVVSSAAGDPPGAFGPWVGALDNDGERIRLVTRQGWLMDELTFADSGDWPTAPDGTGPTLAKRAASYASDRDTSWTASAQTGGTPGAVNFASPPPLAAPAAHVAGAVVINEISYHAAPTYADGTTPFAEDATEWIELHNRSGAPVDLSGWEFDDAVSFTFPAGTSLAAGGFLVVNEAQFSGSLSNRGDSLKLRDAAGALVDKVRYREAGRWPESADGGGATLELRDPAADSTKPEAWAASDESAKQPWQSYSYRALGAEPLGSNNPATWREFLIGLLDGGEFLIDDISVREDPDGANVQVIQNGSFEADTIGQPPLKWRCLGTHKESVVVQDPHGPGKALKVIATGELEHTYNNCGTTLVGNRVINPMKFYEVTFRAKWLAGSPQLNTRLYLNRVARTTILPQPAVAGTPGAVNSRRVANAGPTFDEFVHAPLVPALGQPVNVYARPRDPDGLGAVAVFYSANGAAWQQAAMSDSGGGRFVGTIPAQPLGGGLVQFYVRAADALGAVAFFPAGGPASRALFKIGDGGIGAQPLTNKLRLHMTAADAAFMHNPIHGVSNARFGSTLIANDREVFYDARVRLRSAPFGRQGARAGWNIQFDPEQPFRGTERSIVIDGALNMPRGDGTGFIETTLGVSVNELLFQRVAERAGGIGAEVNDIVYFGAPANGNRRAQLRMKRYSDEFLDEFIPNGSDGALFKQELIYHPTTTVDGNAESLKNPYSAVLAVDIASLGSAKDSYRFNYLTRNQRARDDFSRVIAMGAAFSGSTANLYAASDAVLDLDSWARTLSLNALTGLADTYNQHLAHNIQFFVRPDTQRVMLMPWDQDHAFFFATNFSPYGGDAHRVKDLVADLRFRRRMAGHLLDLCQNGFSNTYLDPWIDHYTSVSGQTYAPNFKSYVSARRAFVLSTLNSQWPATTFAITTNGGANFSTAAPATTLVGNAWINVHTIRRAGAVEPLALAWLSGTTWQVTVPLGAGANAITLEARDYQGAVVGTDTISITNTGPTVPAAAGNLAVSEIMYHPGAPTAAEQAAGFTDADDFEFLELLNVGTNPVALLNARFTEGIAFTFSGGTLAPGARLLLVKNAAAFAQRYGALPVAGVFANSLDNAGERLLLLDRGGVPILDFTYNDDAPWSEDADGAGYSLTLIRPASATPGSAAAWRPSRFVGGTPGTTDSLAASAFPDLLSYTLTAQPRAERVGPDATFTWTERLGADEATLTLEFSEDLNAWQADPGDGSVFEVLSSQANGDGTRTLRVRLTAPGAANGFFRLRAAVVP